MLNRPTDLANEALELSRKNETPTATQPARIARKTSRRFFADVFLMRRILVQKRLGFNGNPPSHWFAALFLRAAMTTTAARRVAREFPARGKICRWRGRWLGWSS